MRQQANPRQDAGFSMPTQRPRTLLALLAVLLGAGVLAFAYGIGSSHSLRAWQIFLVNFIFWSGMAQAGVVFAALLHLTGARWAGPLKRLAEGGAAFLPISLLLFLVLFWGREKIFPWIGRPVPETAAWLDPSFLFARDGIGLLVLYGLSLVFLYYSVRPDLGRIPEGNREALYHAMMRGWRGPEEERRRSRGILSLLSPVLIVVYALVSSLLAFDLVMSLQRRWYSALFGGYFFIGNLYLGLATIAIVAVLARRYLRLQAHIRASHFHDLGKLVFGFCLLWTYLFWSQYLVIWYGDVPEETVFVYTRVHQALWSPLAWSVLILCFLVPFILLLSREAKRRPSAFLAICALVVVGMWLERYVLIVPSLWRERRLPLGGLEILITLGFFAAMALSYLAFLRAFPVVSVAEKQISAHA